MHHLRHHKEHRHLHSVFGDDLFGKVAESIAIFFGTPKFIVIQTLVVTAWVIINSVTGRPFDPYPFVFLNLVFSTQAAYASPFILLAAKRQADRDKANTEADAKHREELAQANIELQNKILKLLEQNTILTERIDALTSEVHSMVKVTNG